jgi:poly-gamma-glutamate capsule biosynthesis protein CapA/YwtB (metallophosphatase superfamily)
VQAPQPTQPTAAKGITVAAVGDIMMGTDYPGNVLPDDDGVGFLAAVAPILAAADVTFGNLEGVLMDGGDAVKRCKPAPKRKTNAGTPSNPSTPLAPPPKPQSEPAPAPALPSVPGEPAQSATPKPDKAAATEPALDSGTQPERPELPAVPVEESGSSESAKPTVPGPDSTVTPAPGSAASPAPVEPAVASQPVEPAAVPATAEAVVAPPPAPAGNCFVVRTPTRYATYLRDAGFDVASLANNHAQDFGDAGRDSTMRTLDAVGILHSGRDGDVAEWTTHGRRFALAAFAPNVGSHQLNDLGRAREIVGQLAAHHDIVIVSFHGGGEGEGASKLPFAHEIYQGEDRGDVVEFAHTVIDAGADLVLGHGPHVLRPMELYRDRLIAYSLGNFATYYGISVSGIRGIGAVLIARLADDGRFLDGRIEPTVQMRPAGPTPDPSSRAVTLLRDLMNEAFPGGRLDIADDGRVSARP